MAVVTRFSGGQAPGVIAKVIDIRDPVANAPGFDQNWTAPMFQAATWTSANFNGGEVFGVTLDDAANPNVYTTSTSGYGQERLGSGKVFKIDGTTGVVSEFTTLPNCTTFPICPGSSYAGLGNIAFDAEHQQFFVTNFFDGKIYRLGLSGLVLETFDPLAPFNPAANSPQGFAPLGERPWGVAVHEGRVYFGVWGRDYREGPLNTVWSVALSGSGAFSGDEQLEVTIPEFPSPSMPVSDITFSAEGRMLLAQRTMVNDTNPAAHQSAVLEFVGGPGAWVPSGNLFAIGISPGRNAAGGVATVTTPQGTTSWVVATGDSLKFNPAEKIYGLQILPPTGGSPDNSYLVDLDGDIFDPDKLFMGDVAVASPEEIVEPPQYADVDIILSTAWDRSTRTRLPVGSEDDDWRVLAGPVPLPAQVVTPLSAWADKLKNGGWIAATVDGSPAPGVDTVIFENCFCIGPDAEDGFMGMINLRLWADDRARITFNGTQIGSGGSFRNGTPLKLMVNNPVALGLILRGQTNCLRVEVPNRGLGTGLVAVGKVWLQTASCEPIN